MSHDVLVLAISRPGHIIAARIAEHLGKSVAVDRSELPHAFVTGRPILAVGALGLWTRLIAPHLRDKQSDPAVVVVDDAARFVIPVIGAHRGGNALAHAVADHLHSTVVITTGTDARDVLGPEALAELHDWRIEATHSALLRVSAALVNEEPLLVYQDARVDHVWPGPLPVGASVLTTLPLLSPSALDEPAMLLVTDRVVPNLQVASDRTVILRPRGVTAGIGTSRNAPADEIEALLRSAMTEAGVAPAALQVIATVDLKRDEAGLNEVARRLATTVQYFTADELSRVSVPTPSAVVAGHIGTPSVAEAAALLSAGTTTLLLEKRRSAHATVALARTTRIDQ